ncbi:hypothetical protein [Candidatus Uabimicrobium sp. HlEnr_7]|uniref:hypothetical protein n=1 Tax=Candidatus Uabimicrobium helgolandensis TaxID=3095367 RepID=UPI003556D0A9
MISIYRNTAIFIILVASIHSQTYFQGQWKLSPRAIQQYGFSDEQNFATFTVQLPQKQVNIPDLLYNVHRDPKILGVRAIPIKDHLASAEITSSGIVIPSYDNSNSSFRWGRGSQLIDSHYNKIMFADENTEKPIFAIAGYCYPNSKNNEYLTQNRVTHLAAYIGNGRLRNAPVGYHNYGWKVKRYPAHLYSISLKGVGQSVLNTNMKITLQLLNQTNYGPRFAEEYDYDWFTAHNLHETLAFYRGWIDPSYVRTAINKKLIAAGVDIDIKTPYQELLLNEEFLQTYCSEHLTIAINCGLNIPQSEAGYIEIWGKEQGKKLFHRANELWQKITGDDIKQQISFTNPLWKRTIRTQKLIEHPDIHKTGVAMAWKPETSGDLIADFIAHYAKFTETSFSYAATAILKLAIDYEQRTGGEVDKYFTVAVMFIEKMLEQDFRLFITERKISELSLEQQQIATEKYFQKHYDNFAEQLSSYPNLIRVVQVPIKKIHTQKMQWIEKPITHNSFDENNKILVEVLKKKITDKYKLTLDEIAWLQFCISVHTANTEYSQKSLMDLARNLPIKMPNIIEQIAKGEKYIQHYSSPAIFHKIVKGLHLDLQHNDILILPLGTVFDYSEVVLNNEYDPSTDNVLLQQQIIKEWQK